MTDKISICKNCGTEFVKLGGESSPGVCYLPGCTDVRNREIKKIQEGLKSKTKW